MSKHAGAAEVGAVDLEPGRRARLALGTTFSLSPSSASLATAHGSSHMQAALRVHRGWVASLDLALALTSYRIEQDPRQTSFRIGNPILGGHYALQTENLTVNFGVGVGAPLVTVPGSIPRNTAALYADTVTVSARGMAGYWLWARNSVPVLAMVRAIWDPSRNWRFDLTVQPAVLISVASSTPTRAAALGTAMLLWRPNAFSLGARVTSLVASRPLEARDHTQTSIGPVLRWATGAQFLGFDASLNLDGPYGLAGATGSTVWGVGIQAGTSL
jgi:hypothetical protein